MSNIKRENEGIVNKRKINFGFYSSYLSYIMETEGKLREIHPYFPDKNDI